MPALTEEKDYQLLRDWRTMDTSLAAQFTDEQLLEQVSRVHVVNGWGLIAELMKRYAWSKKL